jgi:hypothetical protein
MLSDNLRSMAAHFDAWGRRPAPVALDVATCEVLARQMRDLSAQAGPCRPAAARCSAATWSPSSRGAAPPTRSPMMAAGRRHERATDAEPGLHHGASPSSADRAAGAPTRRALDNGRA